MFEQPLPWLVGLSAGVIMVGLAMFFAGRGMTRSGGPGIVAFQLAEDVREVRRIFTRWGSPGKRAARDSLWIGSVWTVLYAALLFVAAGAVGHAAREVGIVWLHTAGRVAAGLAIAAGVLDLIENAVLLWQVRSEPTRPLVWIAGWAAHAKFTLVFLTVLYVLAGLGRVQLAGQPGG